MKQLFKTLLLFSSVSLSSTVLAYDAGGNVTETCKAPKFKEFSLPEYKAPERIEVSPEAEFTFTMPAKADPETLKVTAKKKPLEVEIINKKSFYLVKGKLPAKYTGKYVRIDVQAKALLGCRGLDGWLVKIADAAKTEEQATEEKTQPSTQKTPAAE